MNKENNIIKILNQLQQSEGDGFAYEEESIVSEYQKNNSDKSTLAIKVLSILGGFLSVNAFLGFLLIAGLYNSKAGLVAVGIIFIIAAIWLNNLYDKLIIDTSSISVFVLGFCLLGLALSLFNVNENNIIIIFIMISFCTLVATQNYLLSFISVLIINGSILSFIVLNEHYNLIHLYVSLNVVLLSYFILNEAKIITSGKILSKLYNPIRIGLVFSLLMGFIFIGKRGLIPVSPNYIWLSSIATISSVLYLVSILLNIINIKNLKDKIIIYAVSFLLLLPTVFSPAISGALLIILLSFLVNYKTGLVLGIISFIYFISQYYYDLNFTLLVKSVILFSSGILFILCYLFTNKKLEPNEKV